MRGRLHIVSLFVPVKLTLSSHHYMIVMPSVLGCEIQDIEGVWEGLNNQWAFFCLVETCATAYIYM